MECAKRIRSQKLRASDIRVKKNKSISNLGGGGGDGPSDHTLCAF
jgi:hypothetical protein